MTPLADKPRRLAISPKEVFQEYSLAEQTLANWRSTGRGPDFVRISARKILYERVAIERWLAARRVETTR